MDFQTRFKGKISVMTKEGIQAQDNRFSVKQQTRNHTDILDNIKIDQNQFNQQQYTQISNNQIQQYQKPPQSIISEKAYESSQQQKYNYNQFQQEKNINQNKNYDKFENIISQPFNQIQKNYPFEQQVNKLNHINDQNSNQQQNYQQFQKQDSLYSQQNDNNYRNKQQNSIEQKQSSQQNKQSYVQQLPYKNYQKPQSQSSQGRDSYSQSSFTKNAEQIISNTHYKKPDRPPRQQIHSATTGNEKKDQSSFPDPQNIKNYQPYSFNDYLNLKMQLNAPIKGLGPNITDETVQKQNALKKVSEFSQLVKFKNYEKIQQNEQESRLLQQQNVRQPSKNELAREFAKKIQRPTIKIPKEVQQNIEMDFRSEQGELDALERQHQIFLQKINSINNQR